MSELIAQYASDYINMGEDTEERQNYLNGACTAWNIAILDKNLWEEALRHVMEDYKRINREAEGAKDFEHDLRILIQKKVEMFPEIKKVIFNALIEPVSETKYKINIISTGDKELLKEIFKTR